MTTTEKAIEALRWLGSLTKADSADGQFIKEALARLEAERAAPALTPEWLWVQLMDWCRKRGVNPSDHNALFAIVSEARKFAATPAAPTTVIPHAVREAVEAAFEQRPGWQSLLAPAVRALGDAPAAPAEPVAHLRGIGLTRDTHGMCIVTFNGREVIRDNGEIIDHFASPSWLLAYATPAAPAPAPGPDLLTNIESPFNACMHREHCKGWKAAAGHAPMPLTDEQIEDWRWNWLHGPAGVHPSAFVAGFRCAERAHNITGALVEKTVADIEAERAAPAEPHLFEFWWARYMPNATQAEAWEAWTAAPRADGVGVAATPAAPAPVAHVLFRQDEDGLEPVMFYGPGTAPDPSTLKDRFILRDVWLSPAFATAGHAQKPLTDEPVAWINWSALTGDPRLGWQCESEIASEPLYRKAKP